MFVTILILLPLLALVAAVLAARLSVTRSTLTIAAAGVTVHNYRQAARLVPLDRVVRFEPLVATGNFAGLRPSTAVLVLTDGNRLPVRSLAAPGAGVGVDALNARVEALRRA